jgi:hypothetical protein
MSETKSQNSTNSDNSKAQQTTIDKFSIGTTEEHLKPEVDFTDENAKFDNSSNTSNTITTDFGMPTAADKVQNLLNEEQKNN